MHLWHRWPQRMGIWGDVSRNLRLQLQLDLIWQLWLRSWLQRMIITRRPVLRFAETVHHPRQPKAKPNQRHRFFSHFLDCLQSFDSENTHSEIKTCNLAAKRIQCGTLTWSVQTCLDVQWPELFFNLCRLLQLRPKKTKGAFVNVFSKQKFSLSEVYWSHGATSAAVHYPVGYAAICTWGIVNTDTHFSGWTLMISMRNMKKYFLFLSIGRRCCLHIYTEQRQWEQLRERHAQYQSETKKGVWTRMQYTHQNPNQLDLSLAGEHSFADYLISSLGRGATRLKGSLVACMKNRFKY